MLNQKVVFFITTYFDFNVCKDKLNPLPVKKICQGIFQKYILKGAYT